MEELDSKTCPNCKRDIPASNYTIHSVHCARNIRMCPVCKEPVLVTELEDHHDKMHKLLPCKKCGEQVCGTDLEDHIRDSCAHTIQTCKFCELELPRRDLPAHESYCGVRTEHCPECREWVMIKYRQLHLDSNHGFLRLDDDPAPFKKEVAKMTRIPKPSNIPAASTSSGPSTSRLPGSRSSNQEILQNGIAVPPSTSDGSAPLTSGLKMTNTKSEDQKKDLEYEARQIWKQRAALEEEAKKSHKLPKRTNDQPQINTNTTDKIKAPLKKMFHKKRPAPAPPRPSPPPEPRRDRPFYSALRRQQEEERMRQEQTAYNLAHGLPPVLSPAAKLEKLLKMDRLQNPDVDYEGRSGAAGPSRRPLHNVPLLPEERLSRDELRNLKPMSAEQFTERFNALQLGSDGRGASRNNRGNDSGASGNETVATGNDRINYRGTDRAIADRFSEIKSSLRELRRGLNEVTAPYNSNSGANEPFNERNRVGDNGHNCLNCGAEDFPEGVQLPCEFCGELQPLQDLVQHQTGCRPDLAQLRPRGGRRRLLPHPDPTELPVIPCEFCTESLPVYLISEHQERCRRDANPLYLD